MGEQRAENRTKHQYIECKNASIVDIEAVRKQTLHQHVVIHSNHSSGKQPTTPYPSPSLSQAPLVTHEIKNTSATPLLPPTWDGTQSVQTTSTLSTAQVPLHTSHPSHSRQQCNQSHPQPRPCRAVVCCARDPPIGLVQYVPPTVSYGCSSVHVTSQAWRVAGVFGLSWGES